MGKRLLGIVLFFLCASAGIWVVGEYLRMPAPTTPVAQIMPDRADNRPEQGMYLDYPEAMTQAPAQPGAKTRSLETYHARRAYPGAPPVIPHPSGDPQKINDNCNSCHQNGGYVSKYNAYAPLSPHPEFSNCRQCHVPQASDAEFVAVDWQPLEPPAIGMQAQPTGPNVMPHGVHLREQCQSCHVGPGAVASLRTSHPERTNCRQCHVPRTTENTFVQGETP